jgi:hypothetical protein
MSSTGLILGEVQIDPSVNLQNLSRREFEGIVSFGNLSFPCFFSGSASIEFLRTLTLDSDLVKKILMREERPRHHRGFLFHQDTVAH